MTTSTGSVRPKRRRGHDVAAEQDPQLVEDPPEAPVQLSLDDEIIDELGFGEWVERLPTWLEEAR
jgi:hypothetical protein